MNTKLQAVHLQKKALVYVRQSTFVQVAKNRESALRQYDLVARAADLGWRRDQVEVIDEDQGRSGSTTDGRSGFARLMSEVALGRVGIVLAIEASRLARNNADWQRLIWFCSMTETLLGDQDGLYDPSLLDDRMVLGLKGTISELEWHTIRKRMHEAAVHKARRGELRTLLPAGLEWHGQQVVLAADRSVVDALKTVFAKFEELGSARQTGLWLRDHGVKLPRRDVGKPGALIRWEETTAHAVRQILSEPWYAGAYVYGRRKTVRRIEQDGSVHAASVCLAPEQWQVLIRDHHPGLITWEQFERNRQRMRANYTKGGSSEAAPVREGRALLQGLAFCGKCGRRMAVAYGGNGTRTQYVCRRQWDDRGTDYFCEVLGGRRIEEAVVQLFLGAVQPANAEISLRALEGLDSERQRVATHWNQRVERAEYEAERARERFEAVDAKNRLVADELERSWNEALEQVAAAKNEAEHHLKGLSRELTELERQRVRWMAQEVGRIWAAPTTTARDKKRLLQTAIENVVLTSIGEKIKVRVEWKGGEVSELELRRHRRGEPVRATDEEVVELIRRLAVELDDTQIARVLTKRALRSATGLTFTKRRVQSLRAAHQIPCAPQHAQGETVTAEEAARQLGVSSQTLHDWLRAGVLRGRQLIAGAPWRITLDEQTRRRLAGADAPPGWVGLDEAARRLGVSKQSVSTWVKQGKLEAVRVARGRRAGWRINVSSSTLAKQKALPLTEPST